MRRPRPALDEEAIRRGIEERRMNMERDRYDWYGKNGPGTARARGAHV